MSYTAVKVENLCKKYPIFQLNNNQSTHWFRKLLNKTQVEEFWSLQDINFEINSGEVVGFVGHNGAGKSTLLKILSRIAAPDVGRIRLRGKVGTLLEVGTGFHPELTGHENIYMNGSILGMKRQEISHKIDEIIDFAGISRFMNTPLKHYSTGMQVRLAFAVAAHLETDILLVDEVLAVGDAEFQKKCLDTMSNLSETGRTVLFVSHSMTAIQELCPRTIHLHKGHIVADGDTNQVLPQYIETYFKQNQDIEIENIPRARDDLGTEVRITNVQLYNSRSEPTTTLMRNETFEIEITCRLKTNLNDVTFLVGFDSVFNQRILTVTGFDAGLVFSGKNGDVFKGRLSISTISFMPGQYYLSVAMLQRKKGLDHLNKIISFSCSEVQANTKMDGRIQYGYMQLVEPNWNVQQLDSSDVELAL